jgi:hypothetical protein
LTSALLLNLYNKSWPATIPKESMLSISTGTNSKPDWVCGMSSASPTVHILPPNTDEILPLQNFCIDEKRSYSLKTSDPRAPCLQMTPNDRDFLVRQSSAGEDTEIEFGDNAVVTSVPSKRRFVSYHSLAHKIGLVGPMYVRL